jgi:hypothetical protein
MLPIHIYGSFADYSADIIRSAEGGYIESYTIEQKDGIEIRTTTAHFPDIGDTADLTKYIHDQTLALLRRRHLDPAAKARQELWFLPEDKDILESLVAASGFFGELHPSTFSWEMVRDICLLEETNIKHKRQIALAHATCQSQAFRMTLAALDNDLKGLTSLVGREITVYIRIQKKIAPLNPLFPPTVMAKTLVCTADRFLPRQPSLPAHVPWKNPLGKLLRG